MRFHLPALPGRPPIRANSSCAYSGYLRKFARMMKDCGHDVVVYAGRESDAPATEFVACYPEVPEPVPFDRPDLWADCNQRAIDNIAARAQPGDFLCLTVGDQGPIARALPDLTAVEYRVAYGGTATDRRVFESYAWMHVVYGAQQGAHTADGSFYDVVIPPPFDVDDFPPGDGSGDYLLYVGRMTGRKGLQVAADVANQTGCELILAGAGDEVPDVGTYLGPVGPDQRAALMGDARALIYPTLYVEPGGGAAIEAMMTGTPVITTDWGCFTETVDQGVTGWRCRTLGEFVDAWDRVEELDRDLIRRRAIDTYGLDAIAPQYERYFEQVQRVAGAGWYDTEWSGLLRLGGAPARVGSG